MFSAIEKKLREKLPANLEKIISSSGYECESALLTIDSTSIVEIENFINENKFFLKDTAYEYFLTNNLQFKLKPEHRALILSIPKVLSGSSENSVIL